MLSHLIDQEEILKVLTKFKLQDHAEKFFSMQNFLNVGVRELKEMGLTVKQRKTLLRAIGKYRLALRVKKANALIFSEGARLTPAELQQKVYQILYAPLYAELDWRDARAPIIADWRAQIAKYKMDRLQDHSNLRGLREPGLMEIAKVEAHMMAETLKFKRAGYDKQSERFKAEGRREDGSMPGGEEADIEAEEDADIMEEMAGEDAERAQTQNAPATSTPTTATKAEAKA
jgi:hypothetical protein